MYTNEQIRLLNNDIESHFGDRVFEIKPDMNLTRSGVSRLVMLDRYSFKDTERKTLRVGDIVILTVKNDPKFPARGVGIIKKLIPEKSEAVILVEDEFKGMITDEEPGLAGYVRRKYHEFDKPLELFYEQIAYRVASGLAKPEKDNAKRVDVATKFAIRLADEQIVPAGRVLYGAGAKTDVTFFNCYVMPFPKDSREGIANHRGKVMEIMSRGGGVGTNGSTLRPKGALAKGVNGRSSGSVSWMNDIALLTHLVEQGGSRRGAQMLMLADWHPDIFEFIISKMQNPRILRFLIETTSNPDIKRLAQDKLKFEPLDPVERDMLQSTVELTEEEEELGNESAVRLRAKELLADGGRYTVEQPDFLTGANISVTLTEEFMKAVETDGTFDLRFPDIDNYTEEQRAEYNERWHEVGDVREWDLPVKVHQTIKAKDLWDLINICATYSAEPGIFFIDNANDKTNAKTYGQKVVATNPCGEQPLAPYSVCNLLAINLAKMVDEDGKLMETRLRSAVKIAVRMGDNVVDATPYFMKENTEQALGERRVGLGVMGLADLLIKMGVRYGSQEGLALIDKVFGMIATEAYIASAELAKEKGSFPFFPGVDKFLESGFVKTLPKSVHKAIKDNGGIRNSHLLTVAPTGSTGTMIGVSTGLEPYFAFKYYRSGRLGKFIEVNAPIVQEYLAKHPETDPDNLPDIFVSAMELAPEEHADAQNAIQRWVDSSISKTVNAPAGYSVEEVQKVYERLYKGGAKGGTVYVDGSRDSQVLTLTKDDTKPKPEKKEKHVVIDETVRPLEQTNVKYGNEIGDVCPICRKGKVTDRGGCNECDNCGAQLKCGL
ncbi:vitamin B12-dependent ribonucleotide reductase [Enterococcus faecalis]|nr:vitamin B12-dependent ribonucleotide reductase [Enterococcus faecalis]